MKQLLMQNDRVALVRVPRVLVEPGCVLVQTHYSLISTGTELAGIKAQLAASERSSMEKASDISSKAVQYLGKAINDPAKAAQRLRQIAASRVKKLSRFASKPIMVASERVTDVGWTSAGSGSLSLTNDGFIVESDDTAAGYQVVSRQLDLSSLNVSSMPNGESVQYVLRVSIKGEVRNSPYTLGLLNSDQTAWIGQLSIPVGNLDEELQFACMNSGSVYIVLANGGSGNGVAEFEEFQVSLEAAEDDGVPVSELDDVGWGIGYSLSGEVIAVGADVKGFQIGDRVACGGANQANHAEFVSVAQNLVVKVPKGVGMADAATATVGSIAMQGVRRARVQIGEVACVVGLGLIGMMVMQMLRAAGCKVIGLDLDDQRVARAQELGVTAAYSDFDACLRTITQLSEGHGADATLITAAAPNSNHTIVNNAMKTTRRRGKVVIVGDVGLHVERATFYRKEIDLLMSTSYGPGRYDASYEIFGNDYPYAYVRWTQNRNMSSYLDLVASGGVDVARLVDLVVPLDAATEAYETLAQSERPPMGVIIEYSPQADVQLHGQHTIDKRESTRINIRGARKQRGNKVGCALVGVGGFGVSMLVPQMDKRGDVFQLKAVCSRDPVRGGNFARERSIPALVTEFDAVLADEEIELVVIATRHHEHADQVVRALDAGKHVFVEKPLVLDWAQLDEVSRAYERSSGQILMVGFNRSVAPAIQAVKERFSERRSPLMINYRLNGGFIDADSWIQDRRGGGRNLGEACHMYDLFAEVVGAEVRGVAATSIGTQGNAYLSNDNFVATINFADGSLGNLLYTAAGSSEGLGKERIEVFGEGQAMVIEDFERCIHYPSNTLVWENSTPDKGHEKEFDLLADALLSGDTSKLIPFDRLVETTAVSLHVEDQLQGAQSRISL